MDYSRGSRCSRIVSTPRSLGLVSWVDLDFASTCLAFQLLFNQEGHEVDGQGQDIAMPGTEIYRDYIPILGSGLQASIHSPTYKHNIRDVYTVPSHTKVGRPSQA
jgi:hypothetical protein